MIKSVLEHLIGRGKRIDVTRSCAFVIQAITLVWRVTTEGKSREISLLARVLWRSRYFRFFQRSTTGYSKVTRQPLLKNSRSLLTNSDLPFGAALSSAPRPSDSHSCHRLREPRDGMGSRPPRDLWRRPALRRGWRWVGRFPWPPVCKTESRRRGSTAGNSTRAADRRVRACPTGERPSVPHRTLS